MLLRHSLIYFPARGIPALIAFATIIVYTRLMSPEEFGQYILVVTGALLANAILYQWLNSSLLRFLPRHAEDKASLLNALLGAFVAISLVGAAAGLAAMLLTSPRWSSLVLYAVVLTCVQAWYTLNLELTRASLQPVRYGLIATMRAAIALGLGTLLLLRFDAHGALAGLIVAYCLAGLWASRGQWRELRLPALNAALIKPILLYGLPLTISHTLNALVVHTDRFMLAALLDETATGFYAAGQALAQQSVGVLLLMVNLGAYPLIVHAQETKGPAAAGTKLRKNALLLLAVGLPVTAVLVCCAPEVAALLLGSEFRVNAAMLIPLVAVATLLNGLRAYYFDLAFYLGRRTGLHVFVTGTSAAVNLLANLVLIPMFGLAGAAYASIASYSLGLLLSMMFSRKAFRLPPMLKDFAKFFLATLAMSAVLLLLPRPEGFAGLLPVLFLATAVYIACLLISDAGNVRAYLKLLDRTNVACKAKEEPTG